jgi:DNA replication licensing factor MCM7
MAGLKETSGLNFATEKESLSKFFQEYQTTEDFSDPIYGRNYYLSQLQQISDRTKTLLEVYIEDLDSYFIADDKTNLVYNIINNTKRYQKMMMEVVDTLLPSANRDFVGTVQDVILNQRLLTSHPEHIPAEIKRRYELIICYKPSNKLEILPLRHVGSNQVGKLINVKGIVTRTSDVKPHISVASFVCDVCGHEEFKTVGGMTYLPLFECNSEVCKASHSRGNLHQQTRGSKFISFQEIRIQEPSDQVPMGQVPRSLKVFAYGHSTRSCSPGDLITISGVFLTMPYLGFRAITAGLIHDTFLEAFKISRDKKSYRESNLSTEMVEKLRTERNNREIYSLLSKSIAPEIHGLEDVKKALLLLLVGGVSKEMQDGMKIRGDINILLMGDPGVAKSQLLKHISTLAPRGIYTTGKGSSGVGLTAAVIKDSVTNEMSLEGGALVLSDQGICCIDEFDKMEERDRTSIHEVMEQQSVSIAKAGITTTLNARTSILAAANPLYGRYDRRKTPHENINLPAALLSRFDLVFLLLDNHDLQADLALAEAVTYVHQHLRSKDKEQEILLDANFMRAYIAEAKRINPIIPSNLHNFVIQKYVEKRQEQTEINKAGYVYVTPRTLLGIIRLAQGLARLRFSDVIDQDDIEEGLRLMEASRNSVNQDSAPRQRVDPISAVFKIIREECKKGENLTASRTAILKRVLGKGFSETELNQALDAYSDLNVIMLSNEKNLVTLIQ